MALIVGTRRFRLRTRDLCCRVFSLPPRPACMGGSAGQSRRSTHCAFFSPCEEGASRSAEPPVGPARSSRRAQIFPCVSQGLRAALLSCASYPTSRSETRLVLLVLRKLPHKIGQELGTPFSSCANGRRAAVTRLLRRARKNEPLCPSTSRYAHPPPAPCAQDEKDARDPSQTQRRRCPAYAQGK